MYADKDGIATARSEAVYDYRTKSCLYAAIFLSSLGLLIPILNQDPAKDKAELLNWSTIQWSLAWVHTQGLNWKRNPIAIYTAALRGSLLCLVVTCSTIYAIVNDEDNALSKSLLRQKWAQVSLAAGLAIIQILFPRRPDVYTPDGKLVDTENGVSAFGRYSMRWCTAAMILAGQPNTTLEDIPVLDYQTRSESQPLLVAAKKTLWNQILAERFFGFMKQWMLVFTRSVLDFGSPYFVMRLLKNLESNNGASQKAYVWLVCVGVCSAIRAILNYHLVWIQWSEMGIPVRAQLSMAIFQKVLRRKDAKDNSNDSKDLRKDNKTTKQSAKVDPLNLISSDTVSLSKFTAVNYIIPASFIRFIFAVGFLSKLLGWKSSIVAMFTTLLCVPIYTLLIKKQRIAQNKLASARDRKTKVVAEALHALRQIKFSALETQWEEHIDKFRQDELSHRRWTLSITNARLVWGVTAPFLVAASSVYAFTTLQGASVTPSIIFPMMEILPHLQSTLAFVPVVFQDYFGGRANCARIDSFLKQPEQGKILLPTSGSIAFKAATVSWPNDAFHGPRDLNQVQQPSPGFSLNNVDLEFPVGELSVIHGDTGSGKSLLLAAIIGEADLRSGHIIAPTVDDGSPIAFVSQIPWLQNDTIKNNVLFGNPFDETRYTKALTACALGSDLAALPNGDESRIGLRGVKLSGGQRARLAFARALYSPARVLVIDDIFAALDTQVSLQILKALTGELGVGRTRILATHQVSLCQSVTRYSVHVDNHTVVGSLHNVQVKNNTSKELGTADRHNGQVRNDTMEDPGTTVSQIAPKEKATVPSIGTPTKKIVRKAVKTSARSDMKVYLGYFAASGGLRFTVLLVVGMLIKQLLKTKTTWLLGRINSKYRNGTSKSSVTVPGSDETLKRSFVLYACSALAVVIVEFLFNLLTSSAAMRASKILSRKMTFRTLRMPLLWLDTTPIGVLLKSFTVDTKGVDEKVLVNIIGFSECIVELATIAYLGLYTSSYHGILTVVVMAWCAQISRRYLEARSFVRRADAGPAADILELVTSCSAGISTIRAFGATQSVIDKMHIHLDKLSVVRRHFWIFNRWLGLRMSFTGIIFSTGTGMLLLMSHKTIGDVSLIGALLTFSMKSSHAMFKVIDNFATLETQMNAAQSVIGYSELKTEEQGGDSVSEKWPEKGDIVVKDLEVAYSDKLPLALKGISFTIGAGKRMGIVGRTGAGKSSLTLALLRLLEPRNGSIHIDGINIASIKIQCLRSRIAYIPQDPVLFSGTVRSNLDYFKQVSEEKLEEALSQVKLLAIEGNKDSAHLFSLNSLISAGGANISQGQRQLLCLARVLIKNPKIIILDEATSAVDNETDLLMQETIRTKFKGTLVVVAHRLRTVSSFEQIMVMGEGEILESGKPAELLKKKGTFFDLVQDSQDSEYLMSTIM